MTYKRRARRGGVMAALLAAATSLLVFNGGSPAHAEMTADDQKNADQWVRALAARNGEEAPREERAVLTTRQRALDLVVPGDVIESGEGAVILVIAHGSFLGYDLSYPVNPKKPDEAVSPPHGDMLLVVFDRKSGMVMDWTLRDSARGEREPDLDSLGPAEPVGTTK